jgi:hypothetical protein
VVKVNSELAKQESMTAVKEAVVAPTEAEVLAMREVVLENMTEENIAHLKNVVKNANLAWSMIICMGISLRIWKILSR